MFSSKLKNSMKNSMKNYILTLLKIGLSSCTQIIFVTTSNDSTIDTFETEITTGESETDAFPITTTTLTSETESNGTTEKIETECSLVRQDSLECLSGQVCISDSFEEKGTCVDVCNDSCEDPKMDCVIWIKLIQPPLPDGIGVCI